MIRIHYKFIFIFFLVSQCSMVFGEVKKQEHSNLEMTAFTLENGMKIILKQSELDEETEVRLTAVGGWGSLPETQKASGEYAAQTAIRSGIGSYDFDKLSAFLYDHGLELNAEVLPFSRVIEAQGYPDEMESLFDLIYLIFTQPRFNEIAFNKVKEKSREQINHRLRYSNKQFEEIYYSLNSHDLPAFKPLTLADVDRADFDTSKKFFQGSFSDPSQFVCVVVGKFDKEKMTALISKSLSRIPQPKIMSEPYPILSFPNKNNEVKVKEIKNVRSKHEAMTRITFPLQAEINEVTYLSPEKLSLLLNVRLKYVLTQRYGKEAVIINVTPEYPLYPYFHTAWITVQYISDPKHTDAMGRTILSEIKKLQQEGMTENELQILPRKFKKLRRLNECSNCYWAYQLTNYLLWNWNLEELDGQLSAEMKKEQINTQLKTYISLDNYKILSAKP